MAALLNFAGFQACWFACVLGAAREFEWLGPLVTLVWAAYCVRASKQPARAALAMSAVGALGVAVAAIELSADWLAFRGASPAASIAPAWIIALWIAFASTFDSSFAWATKRTWLLALLALVGAPLSYLAGERLGALDVLAPRSTSLAAVAVLWAAALPLAAALHRRTLGATRAS